jgi:hypothetical protein
VNAITKTTTASTTYRESLGKQRSRKYARSRQRGNSGKRRQKAQR